MILLGPKVHKLSGAYGGDYRLALEQNFEPSIPTWGLPWYRKLNRKEHRIARTTIKLSWPKYK